MKPIILITFLLPFCCFAQLKDDFSDGDFTSNPAWVGDASSFEVDASNRLHLNAPALTDEAHLSTALTLAGISEWEFFVSMDFNPSGSNLFQFHLTSDSINLEADHIGYYVQVGGSSDEVSLFRLDGSSSSILIDGSDDRVDLDPVAIWIKVIRLTDNSWQLYSRLDTDTNYVLEGTATDATYNSLGFCGLLCDYTSTRSTLFHFDDFGYNQPPSISEIEAIDATTLRVTFSEPVESASALTTSNYSVDNAIGQPSTAVLLEDDLVELNFSNSLVLATSYTLTASSLEDTLGNVLGSASKSFEYLNFSIPNLRDVVINEIMADPTPVAGLPELEFVEIYNASDDYFDLNGATFSDPSTTGTVESTEVIAPGEYVILCDEDDTSSFSGFGRTIGLSAFPGLNNSGDELTLTIAGVVVDRVAYSDAWYGDVDKKAGGYTVEQINPVNPCSGASNWIASNAGVGGTPCSENSVYSTAPDTTSPVVLSSGIGSSTELFIEFSKNMDSTSLVNAAYTIDGGITVNSITAYPAIFNGVTLGLSAALDNSKIYTLTLPSSVTDCAGNPLSTTEIEFGIGVAPQPFDLVINELYPDPDDASLLPFAEYVEIFNRSEKLIQLDGIAIADRSSSSNLFSASIKPGEFAIVCDDGYAELFSGLGKVVAVSSMPSLNNSDDQIRLELNGIIIDQVDYSSNWYGNADKSSGGFSLERIDADYLCGLTDNWSASDADSGGTPGVENSIQQALEINAGPDIASAQFESLQSIRVQFDRKMDSASIQNAAITVNGSAYGIEAFDESFSSVVIQGADSLLRGQEYRIEVSEAEDCSNAASTDLSIDFYLHQASDVVINEVLFNPIGSGTDFVELYNQSAYDINLQGWNLAYFDSKDSLRFNQISTQSLILAPQSYVALNEDNSNIEAQYPNSIGELLVEMNLPSYPNTEGSVMLYDPLLDSMERFDYSEDMHFSLIDITDGVSLERLDPKRPASDLGNWHSASSGEHYATPGYANSQAVETGSTGGGFELGSEYISPDNDGYQDVLSINYALGEPGWIAAVTIYNDKGISIRELASNLLLGTSGTITWDGTNTLGEKARTGIHIVLVETYNLKGEKSRYRLPVVVASRL